MWNLKKVISREKIKMTDLNYNKLFKQGHFWAKRTHSKYQLNGVSHSGQISGFGNEEKTEIIFFLPSEISLEKPGPIFEFVPVHHLDLIAYQGYEKKYNRLKERFDGFKKEIEDWTTNQYNQMCRYKGLRKLLKQLYKKYEGED